MTLEEKLQAFERLLNIMDDLREQCPWDRKQTLQSLRTLTIEEMYELTDAVFEENMPEIKKELGDVLLHIVFYAKIASEKDAFDIGDVIHSLCDKLVFRHPHIYGNVRVKDDTEVSENWEQLKLKEKDGNKSVLGGIPKSLPALIKALRLQDKARGVGFDWDERPQVWDKVQEEMNELRSEVDKLDEDKMEAEFGDLFFSMINAARLYGVNPENALERTNQKFTQRFNYLEQKVKANKQSLKDMSLEEMDAIWNEAKQKAAS